LEAWFREKKRENALQKKKKEKKKESERKGATKNRGSDGMQMNA
jgi:hypothetical protein